eukprot:CAMPEP_0173389810 /NCGR_PEP_ID=MMETSP1356-20130122/13541_1 /TAXON_ID=77927 ORGANISM="Hemiselmis virescens, Strain PCC157" /NCGR_SAMPLE_ID=MMETSP1356 /ASSEMBLY_ACC=CAM_ASM_000847 /LENGTH=34 /DNA_ID= /DNA_START= /DNA_END= /DNA_ORIENTATION=
MELPWASPYSALPMMLLVRAAVGKTYAIPVPQGA